MKKKFFVLIFCITTSVMMFAQTTNPLDEKYKPPVNSVFGKGDIGNSSSRSVSDRKSNMISLGFTDFARQNVRLFYEGKLTSTLAVSAGFGIGFGKDIFEQKINFYEFFEDTDGPSIRDGLFLSILYNNSTFKSSINSSFSLKYYFFEDASKSQYICFDWKMANNRFDLERNGMFDPSSLDLKSTVHYFSFMMGFVYRSGNDKMNIVHDFSFGGGLKYTLYDTFISTIKPVDLQNHPEELWYCKKLGFNQTMFTPVILIRYQLGIGW